MQDLISTKHRKGLQRSAFTALQLTTSCLQLLRRLFRHLRCSCATSSAAAEDSSSDGGLGQHCHCHCSSDGGRRQAAAAAAEDNNCSGRRRLSARLRAGGRRRRPAVSCSRPSRPRPRKASAEASKGRRLPPARLRAAGRGRQPPPFGVTARWPQAYAIRGLIRSERSAVKL